jgi:hypothetical protein
MRLDENDRVIGIAVVPAEVDEGTVNAMEPLLPDASEE